MEPRDDTCSLVDPKVKPVIQRIEDEVNVVKAQMEASSTNYQGALGSFERTLNDLKARVGVLETRAQVFGVQRLESLAETGNGKQSPEDDMQEELGLTGKQTKMVLQDQSFNACMSKVQDVVCEALSHACARWMDQLDDKLASSTETQAEMGRTLIREFERSVVARHAERLATAELKLRTLAMEVEKVQKILNMHSMSSTSGEESVDDAMNMEQTHGMIQSNGISPQCLQKASFLEAVEMLRADMQHLVAVDLHTVYSSLQELQKQSVGVMLMVEQQKLALQHEKHSRMQEDQNFRSDIMELKERLSQAASGEGRLGRHDDNFALQKMLPSEIQTKVQQIVNSDGKPVSEVSPNCYHLHSILSSDLVTLSGDHCLQEPQTNAHSNPSSTCDATCQSSSSSVEQTEVQSSQMTNGVRNTLLSYLRSEFQDHVTQVLRGLSSQTGAVSIARSCPAPDSTGSPQETATKLAPKTDMQQHLTPLKIASERISPREEFAGSLSVPVPRLHGGSLRLPSQGGTPSGRAGSGSLQGSLKRAMSPARPGSVSVSVPPLSAGNAAIAAVQVAAKQVAGQAKHKYSARSSSPPVVMCQATYPTAVATAVPVSASMVLQQAGLLTSPRNSFTGRQ